MNTLDSKEDGCVNNNVAGSYLHGIFDNSQVANALVEILADNKGISLEETDEFDFNKYKESQYDKLADCVRKSVNIDKIYKVMGIEK